MREQEEEKYPTQLSKQVRVSLKLKKSFRLDKVKYPTLNLNWNITITAHKRLF